MNTNYLAFNIAIAFDKNYLNPFYALITSIFLNNKIISIAFHCITRDITEKEKQQIEAYISSYNSTIKFYEIDEKLISDFVTMNHWNTSVYYKLFFPLLVNPDIKRLLYLDTDTLVINSLMELFNMDLNNKIMAVIKDNHVKNEVYWELHERENYFNSGVMLIDLQEWNSLGISQKAFDYLYNSPEKIIYVDQDALNVVLENNFVLISEKFNYTYSYIPPNLTNKQLNELLKNIVILHFTLSRPWHFLCKNRFRKQYKYYLNKSPQKHTKVIIDFSFSKIPSYLWLRTFEIYFNMPLIMNIWKHIKSRFLIVNFF
jgi:lipopolysaccharide biosynthesis glycosyltransferase